jgi:flagellar protein FliO/FliZ
VKLALYKPAACLAAICALSANVAIAADGKPFAAPQVSEHIPVSTAGSMVQVTVSLLVVLAAVFVAGWVVKKLRGFGRLQSDAVRIIADLPLGTKERAVLVQVGSQQILLGVAPGRVNTLHVLTEQVGSDQMVVAQTNQSTGPDDAQARPDFKAILKRSLGL